jgi:23S rRNA (guanine745-N1)-methyltransferase
MIPEVVAALECPLCRAPLRDEPPALRCPRRHTFDVARSGYVSFLVGRAVRLGDSAEMLAARARLLDAGHFEPLSAALAAEVPEGAHGLAVEVGAGTARHLARIVDANPALAGIAVDVSPAAARLAARAHPRVVAIVADARGVLPVGAAVAELALVAFAPRNGAELRRILRADGALLVATPLPRHLAELRPALGLLEIDPQKAERLVAKLEPWFRRERSRSVTWSMELSRSDCEALAAMGPAAHHRSAADLAARAGALSETTRVTGACAIEVWRPR